MKRFLLATAAVATSIIIATAGPRIKWLSTEHNFGAFNESVGSANAVFHFVNTGDEPLVITGARANCGCTSPKYDVHAIAPGDSSQISVAYDAIGRPGRFLKKVFVDSNTDPARSILTIRGVVIGNEASVTQRYPVNFGKLRLARQSALIGSVSKGRLKNVYINAYNFSTDTIQPAITNKPKWLDVFIYPSVIGPGEQLSMSFMVRSDKTPLYGVVTDTISIIPDPTAPSISYKLPVVVTIKEDFSKLSDKEMQNSPAAILSTERINLDSIPANKTSTASFSITNDGKSTLKIRRIYSADPGIAISYKSDSIKRGKKADISVAVTPHAGAELINTTISVITNDPISPVQTIRIAAVPTR